MNEDDRKNEGRPENENYLKNENGFKQEKNKNEDEKVKRGPPKNLRQLQKWLVTTPKGNMI